MFDELGRAGDAEVVAAIDGAARAESAAAARRLAAIAELVSRRADGPTDCGRWSCDNWDAITAEVAAALNISHSMASGQLYLAVALRDRLPKVAELLADGTISLGLASSIVWRTHLIKDPDTMSLVDEALAADAKRYGPLSAPKTAQAIDAIVDHHDPAAVRRNRSSARGRDVVVSPADDNTGTAALWGSLLSTDAAVLDRRLTQMADGVCAEDPRTLGQRRADALGTLAAGGETLACACGSPDCPTDPDARAAAIVIHVLAEPATLDAAPDPLTHGETTTTPFTRDMTLQEWLAANPDPDSDPPAVRFPSAYIAGGAPVPASLVAELIGGGAKVSPLPAAGEWPAESGYRPSAALQRFIRCRDMTCRFPGCDRPAQLGDIDHTVPYPMGPTHPSNLKIVCRKHHLLKTFWSGPTGWRDRQHPDGTVTWTSPTGHVYTTRPGSRLLFPSLSLPTGTLPTPAAPQSGQARRGIMMPIRRRTREKDRAYRIDAERALNDAHVAERIRSSAAPPA